jgi:hypothetical protein
MQTPHVAYPDAGTGNVIGWAVEAGAADAADVAEADGWRVAGAVESSLRQLWLSPVQACGSEQGQPASDVR